MEPLSPWRQRYKEDFNAEYEEYQNLHVLIDEITKSFRKWVNNRSF